MNDKITHYGVMDKSYQNNKSMAADQNNALRFNTGPIHPPLVDYMAGRQAG